MDFGLMAGSMAIRLSKTVGAETQHGLIGGCTHAVEGSFSQPKRLTVLPTQTVYPRTGMDVMSAPGIRSPWFEAKVEAGGRFFHASAPVLHLI
jgi:hypothetical protein